MFSSVSPPPRQLHPADLRARAARGSLSQRATSDRNGTAQQPMTRSALWCRPAELARLQKARGAVSRAQLAEHERLHPELGRRRRYNNGVYVLNSAVTKGGAATATEAAKKTNRKAFGDWTKVVMRKAAPHNARFELDACFKELDDMVEAIKRQFSQPAEAALVQSALRVMLEAGEPSEDAESGCVTHQSACPN